MNKIRFIHIHDGYITIVRYVMGKRIAHMHKNISAKNDDKLTEILRNNASLVTVRPFATYFLFKG